MTTKRRRNYNPLSNGRRLAKRRRRKYYTYIVVALAVLSAFSLLRRGAKLKSSLQTNNESNESSSHTLETANQTPDDSFPQLGHDAKAKHSSPPQNNNESMLDSNPANENTPIPPLSSKAPTPAPVALSLNETKAETVDTLALEGEEAHLNVSVSSNHSRGTQNRSTSLSSPDPCDGYRGVLWIDRTDEGAAAATVFFMYGVNFLIYADMYQLLPWVHFNGTVSKRVYDPLEHSGPPQPVQAPSQFWVRHQRPASNIRSCKMTQIGEPALAPNVSLSDTVYGNGIWNSYFQPVSPYTPTNGLCRDKPMLKFADLDLTSMHFRWSFAVKSWMYPGCFKPNPDQNPNGWHGWYGLMRERAHAIVQKYFRPLPYLQQLVDATNPYQDDCIAMHVRTTDKAKSGGRDVIPLDEYLPYVKAYIGRKFGSTIFLATDSVVTLQNITRDWPQEIVERIRMQNSTLLSANATAVFDLVHGENGHHRTNREVLVDTYAMAKCNAFLHGRSAVSEGVFYINLKLHNQSVDLEDPDKPTVRKFVELLRHARANSRNHSRS